MEFFRAVMVSLIVALLLTSGALCMFALSHGQFVVFWLVLLLSGVSMSAILGYSLFGRLDE